MTHPLSELETLLASADQTYADLPDDVILQAEIIKNGLQDSGARQLKRRGGGMDFYEMRVFDPSRDSLDQIDWKQSFARQERVIIDRQAEEKHHVFLWCDPSDRMTYRSNRAFLSKRQAAHSMILAFGAFLAGQDDNVGVVCQGEVVHMRRNLSLAQPEVLIGTNLGPDSMPDWPVNMRRRAHCILWGDWYDLEAMQDIMKQAQLRDLDTHCIMMLDPTEIDFTVPDNTKLTAMGGEKAISRRLSHAASLRPEWQRVLAKHIGDVSSLCEEYRSHFYVQRTDRPLSQTLTDILNQDMPDPFLMLEGLKPYV